MFLRISSTGQEVVLENLHGGTFFSYTPKEVSFEMESVLSNGFWYLLSLSYEFGNLSIGKRSTK
ncbi:hypothetical protein DZC72_00925 [Maribacter algicola]|uniref:Uncharacterized protein n=1 Tax=Maribacter algicola TaxID=2498892 RepID=A0A426RJQ5_9FLAO|nr:hypothetical protein DZC72_00925 [Maribacter algicola]